MNDQRVVRFTLQNLSSAPRAFSLEPYGDYCELGAGATAHATWSPEPGAELSLEVAITDEAVLIYDASSPLCELRPSREGAGGEHWR